MTYQEASQLQQSWEIRADNKIFKWQGGKVFEYNNFTSTKQFINCQTGQRAIFSWPVPKVVADFENNTLLVGGQIFSLDLTTSSN